MQFRLRNSGAATALLAALLIASLADISAAEDVIEFLTGAKMVGEVMSIDKQKKVVSFSAKIGERSFDREYPYSKIHAVTYRGKRFVLNAMDAGAAGTSSSASGSSGLPAKSRTKAEVLELIKQAGSTPPDWYDSTPVEHPPSLDLSWEEPAPGPWNNQKNMGQYIWDIINPNPGRWQSGVRLIHHLLAMHKDDSKLQQRAMRSLGEKYFIFFQDYARAAFWWQQAGVSYGEVDSVYLAECYWRLGNSAMARELLLDPDKPRPGTMRAGMIKLWGDMGQLNKALKLTELYLRRGGDAHTALLMAGDACRIAGRYTDALKFYQRAVDTPDTSNGRAERNINRARANLEAIRLFELSNVSKARDGSHSASAPAYEGPLKVEVVVNAGRIEKVEVTEHTEKQFYSALDDVPAQIIAKQGVKGVDATSRATITAEAIINATAKALAENQK
jgi:uncharacterized protein with FMN-binding domain